MSKKTSHANNKHNTQPLLVLLLSATGFGWAASTAAQSTPEQQAIDQQRRAEQRQAGQAAQLQPSPSVNLQPPTANTPALLPTHEAPCFDIQRIELEGPSSAAFTWLLEHADGHTQLPQPDPATGRCLGAQGVQRVIDRLQNALIGKGYVTSRILAQPQNLGTGVLKLKLMPGQVHDIVYSTGTGQRASRWNTVPTGPGQVLNLRDIEQALENYKRVPTTEADIQITPASEPGSSDLVIVHQQPWPYRLSATADDSGTRSTGKYQGSLTLSYDNWWTLSDLFYLTLSHDLGGADPGPRGTQGHTLHYSVPYGYWLLALNSSNNNYNQTVAGASQNYLYSGTSDSADIKLSRIVHRSSTGKTSLSLKGFQRRSNNYIDDTEVQVQRRVVAGLEWGLNHKTSLSQGSLDANLNYKVGTGAWGSLPAPEEAFGEGTSRMRLLQADINLQQPFELAGRKYNYSGQWRWQGNRTALTPQDRFAIGGRYTVRGFDGLSVLSAERGWLLRNEVSTALTQQVQGYIAADIGHVDGPSAAQLAGQSLSGGVLGLRGQIGKVQWDVFAGGPLHKTQHFNTSSTTAGFSLAVQF